MGLSPSHPRDLRSRDLTAPSQADTWIWDWDLQSHLHLKWRLPFCRSAWANLSQLFLPAASHPSLNLSCASPAPSWPAFQLLVPAVPPDLIFALPRGEKPWSRVKGPEGQDQPVIKVLSSLGCPTFICPKGKFQVKAWACALTSTVFWNQSFFHYTFELLVCLCVCFPLRITIK